MSVGGGNPPWLRCMHGGKIGAVTMLSNELAPSKDTASFLEITARGLVNDSLFTSQPIKNFTHQNQLPLLSSFASSYQHGI